jgi:hypothetical protein
MNSSDAGERPQWCAQLFEVGQDSAYTSLRTTPWFTRKKNRRLYRYYLPVRENKEHAGASGLPRLPAAELEAAVLESRSAQNRHLAKWRRHCVPLLGHRTDTAPTRARSGTSLAGDAGIR